RYHANQHISCGKIIAFKFSHIRVIYFLVVKILRQQYHYKTLLKKIFLEHPSVVRDSRII
ncbi:MAG: hypothetical protein ACRDE5_02645, partial [Ginsengibacter sp.]